MKKNERVTPEKKQGAEEEYQITLKRGLEEVEARIKRATEKKLVLPSRIFGSVKIINPYSILNIPFPSSPEEIRRAYRIISQHVHPDKFAQLPRLSKRAEEAFKKIGEAYTHLTESAVKNLIDQTLSQEPSQQLVTQFDAWNARKFSEISEETFQTFLRDILICSLEQILYARAIFIKLHAQGLLDEKRMQILFQALNKRKKELEEEQADREAIRFKPPRDVFNIWKIVLERKVRRAYPHLDMGVIRRIMEGGFRDSVMKTGIVPPVKHAYQEIQIKYATRELAGKVFLEFLLQHKFSIEQARQLDRSKLENLVETALTLCLNQQQLVQVREWIDGFYRHKLLPYRTYLRILDTYKYDEQLFAGDPERE